jgi:DNA-binding IclR family transcriptional regulator
MPTKERDKKAGAPRVQVIERSIDILRVLAKTPSTLSEVSRLADLPKGTTFRILGSLQYEGLVLKDPIGGTYRLGPGFLRLGQTQMPWFGALEGLAQPGMHRLGEATGETIAIHVRIGAVRLCVCELPSPQHIRYSADVGAQVAINVGSAGRVLLAQLEEPELEKVLSALKPQSITDQTIVDFDEIRAEVAKAREVGYSQSIGERITGGAGISVPVALESQFDASLSVIGPESRFNEEVRLSHFEDLLSVAAEIGKAASLAL